MQRAGNVHHAAERHQAQGRLAPDQRTGDLMHRAVATRRDHQLPARLARLSCQFRRVPRSLGQTQIDVDPLALQRRQRLPRSLLVRGKARLLPRVRIGDQYRSGHHLPRILPGHA